MVCDDKDFVCDEKDAWREKTMLKRIGIAILVIGLGSSSLAYAGSMKRLSEAEKDHYYALRVWMEKKVQKKWLRLKTEEERSAYLKKEGLWERFYSLDEEMRGKVVAGEVEVGWPINSVLMAWGMPHQRKRLTGRKAARSELFVYRFEVDPEGYVSVWEPNSKTVYKAVEFYQIDAVIDDSRVAELRRKDKWE
jgi:hypothetical protein